MRLGCRYSESMATSTAEKARLATLTTAAWGAVGW